MLVLLRPIAWTNTRILRLGRQLAWVALALMVLVILSQVFFRYVLNNALAWPDEAARFLMLWMIAFIAPSAMRWSGFVSIDLLPRAMARVPSLALGLVLLVLSLAVLLTAVGHGYNHTFGFGGKFDSSSLRIPLELVGLETVKVKLRYMYGSLLVCVTLLILVTVELILRILVKLFLPDADLPPDDTDGTILAAD